MQRFQNRPTAVAITILVVLLSVLIGAAISLGGLRRTAEQVFERGSDGSWNGIESDVYDITSGSYNLITIAERYLGENDVDIAAVEREIDSVYAARKPGSIHDAVEELRGAINGLDQTLRAQDLSEEDKALLIKTIADIEASYRKIDRSDYNDIAREFNDKLKPFPANVLSGIVGVEPLELYE